MVLKYLLTNNSFYFAVLRDDFRNMPFDTQVAEGERAVLHCAPPRGNPAPQVKWLKDGQYIEDDTNSLVSTGNSRLEVAPSGDLVLHRVTKTDEGDYVCRASNMVGTKDSESARLSVHGKTNLKNTIIWEK